MSSRQKIAVQVSRTGVQVAAIRPGTFGGALAAAASRPWPAGVDPSDATAVGQAVAAFLKELGLSGRGAVFALSRSLASTKRLDLPTRESAELPEMTRLAMQRDLPIDAASAEIDYALVETTETGSRVLAVAVPGPVVRFQREVAKAAGLEVEAISLRCLGAAHLVGRLDPSSVRRMEGPDGLGPSDPPTPGDPTSLEQGSLLAVDIGPDDLELTVVGGGSLLFSRGVGVQDAESTLLKAEAVTMETRRTWLSYRISQGDERVAAAVVLGGADVARLAVPQLAASTGLPCRQLRQHPDLRTPDPEAAAMVWPLLGLLLERRHARHGIDLAHPKRPPDLARRRRMRVLAAAGVMVVAALGGWTIGKGRLRAEETRATELEGVARKALADSLRLKRDRLRLGHLEAWSDLRPAWLDHAMAIRGFLPEGDEVLIDGMQGTLTATPVRYERGGKFVADGQVRLVVEGEAVDRAAADELRDRIVEDRRYQLRSTGADAAGGRRLPIPFSFQLRGDFKDEVEAGGRTDASSSSFSTGGEAPTTSAAGASEESSP
ncbi:MAG: hypothetical protein FJ257_12150 [Phycisphaerae bacterium]|nr:hypothetical protein [Phycisphaerae bacterium]